MAAKLRVVTDEDEKNEAPPEDIDGYLKDVEAGRISLVPYDRLMIYYRKEKRLKEELQVIKKGIDTYKKYFALLQKKSVKKKNQSTINALSKKIGTSMGLIDKKGNDIYLPEPLPRWIKRMETVQQKLKKKK